MRLYLGLNFFFFLILDFSIFKINTFSPVTEKKLTSFANGAVDKAIQRIERESRIKFPLPKVGTYSCKLHRQIFFDQQNFIIAVALAPIFWPLSPYLVSIFSFFILLSKFVYSRHFPYGQAGF